MGVEIVPTCAFEVLFRLDGQEQPHNRVLCRNTMHTNVWSVERMGESNKLSIQLQTTQMLSDFLCLIVRQYKHGASEIKLKTFCTRASTLFGANVSQSGGAARLCVRRCDLETLRTLLPHPEKRPP